MGQNLPCALAAIAASAASMACWWNGSGWLRNATRTSLPYLSSISLRVGPTLEQKGHWKSENSRTVTFAYLGPCTGVHDASSTRAVVGAAVRAGAASPFLVAA